MTGMSNAERIDLPPNAILTQKQPLLNFSHFRVPQKFQYSLSKPSVRHDLSYRRISRSPDPSCPIFCSSQKETPASPV